MGLKSRTRAEKRKEGKKNLTLASLKNVPTSPRKMRLMADLIRGKRVEQALHLLKTGSRQPSAGLHKLLLSAIANWQLKNEGKRIEESELYIQEIHVDSGRVLKRIQPAPQGRAHRIRKRSNHVTIQIGSLVKPEVEIQEPEEEIQSAPVAKTRKETASKEKPETATKGKKVRIPKQAPQPETGPEDKPEIVSATEEKPKLSKPAKGKKETGTKTRTSTTKETKVKTKNKKD